MGRGLGSAMQRATTLGRVADRRVRERAGRWLPALLLAAGAAYFVMRGPVRALAGMDGRDLTVFYTATRAWLQGVDPYDHAVLADVASAAGIVTEPSRSLNPPTTFPLLAPWAALPWPLAQPVWTALEVVLVGVCLVTAMKLAGLRAGEPRAWLFLGFGLALAPFHTAISEGQLSIAVAALVLSGLLAIERDRPIPAGVAVALAVALKPQMGLVFLGLLLVRAHHRALSAALVTLCIVAGVGAARMWLAGVDWLATLLQGLAASHFADPTTPSTQRLNLQALLNVILPGQDGVLIQAATLALGLVVGSAVAVALRRRHDREADLLAWSTAAVLTLLMVYNRSYDAVLLLLAVAWVFTRARPASPVTAAAIVIGCAAFLVPGAAALANVQLPADLRPFGQSVWWGLLRVHQVIALLVVLGGLTAVAVRGRIPGARSSGVRPSIAQRHRPRVEWSRRASHEGKGSRPAIR